MAGTVQHKQETSSNNEAMFSEEDKNMIFKKEHVLDNKHETLENKIKALITTWGELGSLRTIPSPENMQTLTEFLKSHTLNLVLSASWLRYKDKYYNELMNSISKCKKVFGSFRGFQLLCIKLVTIADCPWKKKTINRYLNTSDIAIDIEDYNFFVHEESAYFISMRLKKLCDEGCEDIALNLTRAYLKCCEWAEMHDKPMYISDAQKKFVFDAYLALLYKFNHIGEMSQLLKAASLSEGVDMVRRFATKQISVSKLWVNTISIAHLSGTIFITRGVLMPLDQECAICLNELLNVWLPTYEFETEKDELIACLRRIMKNAKTAPHMYTISNNLSIKYGVTMRTYNVEIYIQALNTDLNLLERLKQEEQEDKVDEVTGRIADGLWDLSNLLIDNISVSKECILTAFSLKPTERCFKRIEEFARLSGKDVLDTGQWICKFHPAPTENDDLLIICDKCGDFMAELKITAITRPNISLTEALQNNNMGLSPQLCDDLVVIIFCARYQLLNWLQNWNDLHRLCIMYLNDPVSTKNLITELKFLEIDYTPFLVKRELESLEQYDTQIDQVISDEYQDTKKKRKRKRILSTDEEDEEEEEEEETEEEEEVASRDEDYLAHCQKSDPEVLKTLRSFRRTLKSFDPEPMDHFNNRMPVQTPIPPWHEVALDYSGSNTDGAQSSSSSYSPLNEPVLHNPEIAGIQIRKDIYNDPNDHFKALEFFRATNPNVDVLRYNLDERNFHNPPVIQVNQSLSLQTKNEVAYNKAASCSNNCNVLIKRTDQSLNSGEDLKYRVNNNSEISNSEQAILEQNDFKTAFPRNDRGLGVLESARTKIIPVHDMYYKYFTEKHHANNNDINPLPEPCLPESAEKASPSECTDDLRNLKNQSNSQTTEEKIPLPETTTKDLIFLESAEEKNVISFEEKIAEGIENMELTDIELVSINNLPASTLPIDDNVFEEMEELLMPKDAEVSKEFENTVAPTVEPDIKQESVPVVVKDDEDMEVSYVKEVIVKTENDMVWVLPDAEMKEEDDAEQSNIVNMEQNVNNLDVDADEEKEPSEEEENSEEIFDNNCSFDKEKEADADVKESELSDSDTSDLYSLLNTSNYTKVEFELEITPAEKDIVSPCKVVLEKLNYDENIKIKEKSHLVDLKEKFKMKECSVILNRLQDSVIKKQLHKDRANKKRGRGRPRKTKIKLDELTLSENNLTSDKSTNGNYNCFTLPLQSKNQQVSIISNKSKCILEDLKRKLLVSSDKMNPRVILKRLDDSCIKSLLARVPGISDTNLFRPENTDQIVNVVQVAGGRATSTVQAPNTQTSTQVSPHIQRIGQPRNEKSEQVPTSETSSSSISKSSNSYTVTKPVSTQSPTLINILSQQIIRPSNSNNTRRAGPLINILSQQTIRPASTSVATKTSTTVTGDTQGNSRIIATSTDQQQIINQIVNPGRTTGSLKTVVGTSNSEQGRIVQFICKSTDGKLIPVTSFPTNRLVKVGTTQAASDSQNVEETYSKMAPSKKTDSAEISETLPKFQQAFGKSVYQNNADTTNATNITNNANAEIDKNKTQIKNSTVSMQPIQGSVIYTRQMPVGQTINLIPQTRGQVFRIATTNAEQISLVKDTVIHSKMSALLAAALQGKPKNSESTTEGDNNTDSTTTTTTTTTRVQLTRPALVQNARIVKPVLQIPSNVIRNAPQTNLSSTTLEQLREFDMVYKQVKERSSTSTPAETSAVAENSESSPQRISVTYLNQGQKLNCAPVVVVSSYNNLQPAASPALSVASQGSSSPCITPAPTPTPVLPKVAAKSSKGKSVKNAPMHASKTSPIPKPQQKPQEDEHTTQRIFDILAEYAEQLRNSPDLNNKPAPRRRSNPPTNPSQNSKRKKNSSSKKTGQCSSLSTEADIDDPRTVGSEDSSCGVVQLSMQDEEQTPTAVSTSESNDSTITTRQQLILTDSTHNQTRNLIIADSSVGEALKMPNTAVLVPGNYIMPVSMVKGGQQIAVVSGGSKILATVPARSGPNMLLFQSFLNQNRKTNVPTVKYSTIQPISGISSQTLTGVSAQPPVILPPPSHGISTVTLGQPIAIKKIDETDRVNTELLLTISQSRENNCTTAEDAPQSDSSVKIETVKIESDLDENTAMSDNSSEKTFSYQKPLITAPIATPVIAQTIKEENSDEQSESTATQTIMTLNINPHPLDSKGEGVKAEERVQSVLVTAGSSIGPMLAHSPPQYKQSGCNSNSEQTKDDYLRNGGKRNEKVQQNSSFCIQGKVKKNSSSGRIEREVQQICMQRRQAAIERELRLQKSLSEECEDLGVDEPSTSDLFPEALLYDANNSPSFDQTSHDLLKRSAPTQEKEENKLTLFSDDDFMFETNQYQSNDNQLCYEEVVDSRMLTNGQNTNCEDNTLLQTCTSMSDVTLCSPISPDTYNSTTPPPLNKYMHKYTNKKKNDRIKQVDNWTTEVSSSEDTTGSNELGKRSGSPDTCLNKRSDEETDGSFKVVRLSISKSNCSDMHCTDSADCSISGRGARKSVKKKCSCCNGSEDNMLQRKRPSSQQHANNPHKKAFLTKKR